MDEALIARIFQLFLALTGAYLLALWFALVVWTYRDITSRSTNAFTQIFSTLVVVLFFVPGALIYLILRPRETLDEAFQRSMEEEYLLQDLDDYPLCPVCRRAVRDDFVFCPHCSAELRHACMTCHRLVDVRWEVCPYCGSDQTIEVEEEPRELIREAGGSRSRSRVSAAPLQAIDGGRAKRRPSSDQPMPEPDGRQPRQLREEDHRAAELENPPVAPADAETTDEHPVAAAPPTKVRNPRGRGRATAPRQDGSDS